MAGAEKIVLLYLTSESVHYLSISDDFVGDQGCTDAANELGLYVDQTSAAIRNLLEKGLVQEEPNGVGKRRIWATARGIKRANTVRRFRERYATELAVG